MHNTYGVHCVTSLHANTIPTGKVRKEDENADARHRIPTPSERCSALSSRLRPRRLAFPLCFGTRQSVAVSAPIPPSRSPPPFVTETCAQSGMGALWGGANPSLPPPSGTLGRHPRALPWPLALSHAPRLPPRRHRPVRGAPAGRRRGGGGGGGGRRTRIRTCAPGPV